MDINDLTKAFDTGENLVDRLSQEQRDKIAYNAIEGYKEDENSRSVWTKNNQQAMKLALQVMGVKNTPWANSSNVKFPAITIPALQFAARAYPTLIEAPNIVKCRAVGQDPQGLKTARARRVSTHMSWQVLEQDEGWEAAMDQLLITLPIVGCSFKKTYFDTTLKHNVSEHVLAEDLVVNYWTKTLSSSPRYTHRLWIDPNVIEERMRMDIYHRCELTHSSMPPQSDSDQRQGISPSPNLLFDMNLEQYAYLDLDNDGYKEPYTLLVHEPSSKLLRLTPRFSAETVLMKGREVAKINAIHFFTKYGFVPSPDGGFYDLGFGQLLGPLNETINTIINQLVDAGTIVTLGGGFLGRGARMKKGEYLFRPGEWKAVDASGDDLRKSVFPLPVREPSQTLFQMLNLLIDYSERISSVSDMMVGKTPGQNTPATTSMAALEQGMKVFTGIYKRVYRSLKEEFRKLYTLNSLYLNEQEEFDVVEENVPLTVYRDDYKGAANDIVPNADPNIASEALRKSMAMELKQAAATSPYYDGFAVEKRYVQALGVHSVQEILPEDEQGQPVNKPQPDPKLEIEKQKINVTLMDIVGKLGLYEAQVEELNTKALLNIAKSEAAEEGTQITQYQTILDGIREMREMAKQTMEAGNEQAGIPGMAGQPDDAMGGEVLQGP